MDSYGRMKQVGHSYNEPAYRPTDFRNALTVLLEHLLLRYETVTRLERIDPTRFAVFH